MVGLYHPRVEYPVLAWQFGAFALAIAMMSALAAGKLLGITSPRGRNVAVDGLRGYLAFGVFLHHAVVWYFYLRSGAWGLPPASIYRELGATCVSLFFMITGYLFVGKLLDARARPIDWLALYISRVLRLTPLYLLAMCVLFLMVGALSGWQLREPLSALLAGAWQWLMFSIFAAPDLNVVHSTAVLIAFVTWTLAYEWLFYLCLPALAVVLRAKAPVVLIVGCSLLAVIVALNMRGATFPSSFAKGAIAAFISRQTRIAFLLRRPMFGAIILAAAWVALFGHVPRLAMTALIAVAFCVVACGNTAFGLLSNRAAVVLGDISYGVYLLHGLVLSATFIFLVGSQRQATSSPMNHWLIVMAVGVAVVTISALTYRFIEQPSMRRVKSLSASIRSNAVFNRLSSIF